MSDLIDRKMAISHVYVALFQNISAAEKADKALREMLTIDAVPRQKYEEDMENAFAHGYTDAESDFRKMIEGGELVDVVRCKDCKYWNPTHRYCEGIGNWFGEVDSWSDNGFCFKGERRTDE